MDKELSKMTLEKFCSFDLRTSKDVLDCFASLPNAISHFDGGKSGFVYVPGDREDRVLLVAHADTVWDFEYSYEPCPSNALTEKNGVYRSSSELCGIGADDRAGCAMLWLLRDSGHSLLVVDGEEHGQIGSHNIAMRYPNIFDELNNHSYMLQFDRRNSSDYKVYNLPVSQEFTDFIEKETGYNDAGKLSRTDIVVLCRDICGANLSVGYHYEHTSDEMLVFDEWFNTLQIVEGLLSKKQTKFPLRS